MFIESLRELLNENNNSVQSITEKTTDPNNHVTALIAKQIADACQDAHETTYPGDFRKLSEKAVVKDIQRNIKDNIDLFKKLSATL